jgi:2-polyprenyl-3-methyl-5-hydroxy-6-metoxy-1,4-benzoquinol methylase
MKSIKHKTRESQYSILFNVKEKTGVATLGLMINEAWQQDPRRALFVLSRYKFVSKVLSGKKNVLEIGCADAFGTRLVQQTVERITVVDFDPVFISDIKERYSEAWPMRVLEHDIVADGPVKGKFDGIYALDVLEHIPQKDEIAFIKNCNESLRKNGVLIVGMPSIESQTYASPQSKAGHVNCKSGEKLQALFQEYFENVFLFSMNDEVVHTGYSRMAHYIFVICSGKK